MKTILAGDFANDKDAHAAEGLLRSCVHCGFCNTACPTYLLLGEENNGPRGRIYQMKIFLETGAAVSANLKNLDQCLTCQACETACPSGVQYGSLLDIMRPKIAAAVHRPLMQRLHRRLAVWLLMRPRLLRMLLRCVSPLSGLLARKYRVYLGLTDGVAVVAPAARAGAQAAARVVFFDGCVQSAIKPAINARAAAVCTRVGMAVEEEKQFCCGALQLHLEDTDAALERIRANVDKLYARLQDGADYIVSTASGCGRTVADYGHLLADDADYAEKARAVSAAHRDIAQLLAEQENLDGLSVRAGDAAFHCPCTLQNAQKQGDAVTAVFARLGGQLQLPADGGRCCGSAGFYSQEHVQLAETLRDERLAQFSGGRNIVTANIGCQLHLQGGTDVPVTHWIEEIVVGDRGRVK